VFVIKREQAGGVNLHDVAKPSGAAPLMCREGSCHVTCQPARGGSFQFREGVAGVPRARAERDFGSAHCVYASGHPHGSGSA
jgi:hypothetical protein